MRIIQISDTHISHLGGAPSENMSLMVDYVNNEVHPDLVVHTGDVVIADPDSAQDRATAWSLHQKIDAPLLVLPGNHDVGESADDPWMGISVTSDRITGFTRTWGPDRFFLPAARPDDWVLVGLNSERFSSGLPEEGEQWEWLADVAEQVRGRPVMLFLHKPLWFPGTGPGLTIAPSDRERLVSVFAGAQLRAVANGHVHRHWRALEGEILTVTAPSLTFAPPPDPERGLGPGSPAIVEYRLDGDAVEANLLTVPGTRGVEDVLTMPEFTAAVAGIEASR
jgi:3',5'-cyclic AMP phosphodiesterase CpdA